MKICNKNMKKFMLKNRIKTTSIRYNFAGSMKGTWNIYGRSQKWTPELIKKFTDLKFTDFDGRPLSKYSGNGDSFSISVIYCGSINFFAE